MKINIFLIALGLFSISCSKEIVNDKKDTAPNTKEWLIPKNEVRDGGPGKDGIPSLENPDFVNSSEVSYIDDNDLILGYVNNGVAKAYPHSILDWHEIINDDIDGIELAITYCPLTGTGIAWDRNIDGKTTTFGVSGLLYNTNLIPYDRHSNSNWSQIRLDCVNGKHIGKKIKTYQLIETSWSTWKKMYPSTKVVSKSTGFARNYGFYPYGDYRTNDNKIIFPLSNKDSRLPNKERVHGLIIDGKTKVYSINLFDQNIKTISDEVNLEKVVVIGSKKMNFVVSFKAKISDGTILNFTPIQNSLPSIIIDNEGTEWNVFGEGLKGPRKGEKLIQTTSFMGYWLAWAAFYPEVDVYKL